MLFASHFSHGYLLEPEDPWREDSCRVYSCLCITVLCVSPGCASQAISVQLHDGPEKCMKRFKAHYFWLKVLCVCFKHKHGLWWNFVLAFWSSGGDKTTIGQRWNTSIKHCQDSKTKFLKLTHCWVTMSYELTLCISKLAVFLTDGGLATAHFLGDAKLFTGEHGLAAWFYLRGFFFFWSLFSFQTTSCFSPLAAPLEGCEWMSGECGRTAIKEIFWEPFQSSLRNLGWLWMQALCSIVLK